jgi:hypothetical protein
MWLGLEGFAVPDRGVLFVRTISSTTVSERAGISVG